MSIELIFTYQSGANLSAKVFAGEFSQDFALTESAVSGVYQAIITSPIAGHYYVTAYDGTDIVGNGEFDTDGINEIFVSSRATLADIEASTVLAKASAVAAIPNNPLLQTDVRLDSLDAHISTRLASADYTDPPSVSNLATSVQLNNAVSSIVAGFPIVDLAPIISKLPSDGAKISGEGATAKNLDQILSGLSSGLTTEEHLKLMQIPVNPLLDSSVTPAAYNFILTPTGPISPPTPIYYCTKLDMVNKFGVDELIQRTDRDNSGSINDEVLISAIASAKSEIDGYLVRYALPLLSVPPILATIACDISRYRLYDDQVIEVVDKRYKDAIAYLKMLSVGTATLGIDAAGTEVDSASLIEMSSGRSVFS